MTEVATSGWIRPEPWSVVGFAILFLLFTLSGYVVRFHIRAHHIRIHVHWLKTGIVGLLFIIAIGYGFATSLWIVDRLGLYEPYASGVAPVARTETDGRVFLPNGAEAEPTFTVEHPSLEPTRPPEG